jgi:hypothetical protein
MNANDRKRALTTAAIATARPLEAAPVTSATVRNVLLDIDAALLADLHRVTCALASITESANEERATRRGRAASSVQEPLKQIAAILREARTRIADVEARL